MKRKIIFLVSDGGVGGAQQWTSNYAKKAVEWGCDVLVVSGCGGAMVDDLSAEVGVDVCVCACLKSGFGSNSVELFQTCFRFQADAIICSSAVAGVWGRLLSMTLRNVACTFRTVGHLCIEDHDSTD